MMITYVLWDDKNRRMESFAGPCRLASWRDIPPGWTIEEFIGDVSRGMVSHADVKAHADKVWRAYAPPARIDDNSDGTDYVGSGGCERSDCPGF